MLLDLLFNFSPQYISTVNHINIPSFDKIKILMKNAYGYDFKANTNSSIDYKGVLVAMKNAVSGMCFVNNSYKFFSCM